MAINLKFGTSRQNDPVLNHLISGFEAYVQSQPAAQIDSYRQDKYTVRVRVIDPQFEKIDHDERHRLVWNYLMDLPNDASSDVYPLICLAPGEVADSVSNFWFEHPKPAELLSA